MLLLFGEAVSFALDGGAARFAIAEAPRHAVQHGYSPLHWSRVEVRDEVHRTYTEHRFLLQVARAEFGVAVVREYTLGNKVQYNMTKLYDGLNRNSARPWME